MHKCMCGSAVQKYIHINIYNIQDVFHNFNSCIIQTKNRKIVKNFKRRKTLFFFISIKRRSHADNCFVFFWIFFHFLEPHKLLFSFYSNPISLNIQFTLHQQYPNQSVTKFKNNFFYSLLSKNCVFFFCCFL